MAIGDAIRNERSVAQAAEDLGISAQRVRALIAAGELPARRIGAQWVVDGYAVRRRAEGARLHARPFSSRNAWAALALAAGEKPVGVDAAAISRLRRRLRSDGLSAMAPLLVRRARRVPLRVHPGERDRLLADPALVLGGAAAASRVGLGLIAPESAEAYVPAPEFEGVVKRHALRRSANPNVLLRVVDGPWPFSPDARVAPLPVVAVDLLEDEDPRSQAAGRAALR